MGQGQTVEEQTLAELLRRVKGEEAPARGKGELREICSDPIEGGLESGEEHRQEILSNLKLRVKVELGRRRMPLKEALNLRSGTVVELGKEVGEPVELLVNGTPIARGEVMVVDDRFCVRITQLLTSREEADG